MKDGKDTTMSTDLTEEELDARFAREDAEDAANPDLPLEARDITTYEGFASGGVVPTVVDGQPYAEAIGG